MKTHSSFWIVFNTLWLTACGGGGGSTGVVGSEESAQQQTAQDIALRDIITNLGLTGDPARGRNLPSINEPLPQLGKNLFFSFSLGGNQDASCASCHHPSLGGADAMSLSVGVDAIDPQLLGIGREDGDGLPAVPRNAPTVFNSGLWDTGLFWDSRVESLGREPLQNGAGSGIRTPDSPLGVADPLAGNNLLEAQARFPLVNEDEMRSAAFEAGASDEAARAHLAARIGDYGQGAGELSPNLWSNEFQQAFGSSESPENLVTVANIMTAIGEYERSMVFVDTPWKQYIDGDLAALTEQQKAGAMLFFTPPPQGGAGCAGCHRGDLFSDGSHHTVAFPQIGPGKGDDNGITDSDDFGRERETGQREDRYRFRVPTLLNVSETAPYGHSGAYATLEDVVNHYNNPAGAVRDYFNQGGWCQLPQFSERSDCASLYPDAAINSDLALQKLRTEQNARQSRLPNINLSADEVSALVSFLESLTDPCITDRECLGPWIPEFGGSGPDGNQLNAYDQSLSPL